MDHLGVNNFTCVATAESLFPATKNAKKSQFSLGLLNDDRCYLGSCYVVILHVRTKTTKIRFSTCLEKVIT